MQKKSEKKTVCRLCSYLLSAAMVAGGLTLSPIGTLEIQAAATAKNVNLNVSDSIAGIENPTVGGNNGSWEGCKVYFGDKLYRILDKNGQLTGGKSSEPGNMLLLLDDVLEENGRIFDNGDPKKADWSISNIHFDLNNTGSNRFLSTLTSSEQDGIQGLSINAQNTTNYFDYYGGSKTYTYPSGSTDKIFLLDIADVRNANYGFQGDFAISNTRATSCNGVAGWWIRSPGQNFYSAAGVAGDGGVHVFGTIVNTLGSARPALNLKLASILFSTAAGVDKSTAYASFEQVTSDHIDAKTWKLTLEGTSSDMNPTASGPTSLQTGYQSYQLTVNHTAANAVNLTGVSQVSAMLTDSDEAVLYYGRVNDITATSTDISIPEGLSTGSYELYVFAEVVNNGHETDYASAFGTPIEITVGNPPAPTQAPTSRGHGDGGDNEAFESGRSSNSVSSQNPYVNPLSWIYVKDNLNSLCTIEKQGALCARAFADTAKSIGYIELFSFNLSIRGTDHLYHRDYTAKSGKFILMPPKEYQRLGCKMALIGIDKTGKTKMFYDSDKSDTTITIENLEIEGYAFDVVYLPL